MRSIAVSWAFLLPLLALAIPTASRAATLTSITVTPDGSVMRAGFAQSFTATGHFSDGSTANVTQTANWSVSSVGIAVVQNNPGLKGFVTAVAKGTTRITAAIVVGLTTVRGSAALTVTDGDLVSITTKPTTKNLEVGQTSQFKATALYLDSSTKDITKDVTWTSTDPSIASVSNTDPTKGLVTPKKVGTVTIFAQDSASGVTNSDGAATVRAQVSHLSFDPPDVTIGKGMKFPLRVYANRVDDSRTQITDEVEFSVVPTGVISIGTGDDAGIVTALKNGSVTISAFDAKRQLSTSSSGDDAKLKVKGKLVELHVESNPIRMAVGDQKNARAIGTLSSGRETSDLRRLVQWSISDPSIATVGNTVNDVGELNALKSGIATLHASYGNLQSPETDNVQVLGDLQSLVLEAGDGLVPLNEKVQIKARGTYEGGIELNLTDKCDWTIVNPTIAQVDNSTTDGDGKGGVTGVKIGQTTVNANCSGMKASAAIGVIGTLVSLRIDPTSFNAEALDAKQFRAFGKYSDNSEKDLTKLVDWSSSNPSVASIDTSTGADPGTVLALTTGSTTIKAQFGAFTATSSVSVAAGLVSIQIVPPSRTVRGSIDVKLRAKGTLGDPAHTVIDVTKRAVWSSANDLIARVSNREGEQGLTFGGRQEGTTQITASVPNTDFTSQATITTSCLVKSFSIARPSDPQPVPVGQARYVRARATFCDDTTDIITPSVVFTSSNPNVLTVSNEPKSYGLATGVAPGSATITAFDPSSGKSATNSLVVNVQ